MMIKTYNNILDSKKLLTHKEQIIREFASHLNIQEIPIEDWKIIEEEKEHYQITFKSKSRDFGIWSYSHHGFRYYFVELIFDPDLNQLFLGNNGKKLKEIVQKSKEEYKLYLYEGAYSIHFPNKFDWDLLKKLINIY